MRGKPITMTFMRPEEVRAPWPHVWKFEPSGWLARAQRLAWRFLSKSGALKSPWKTTVEYTRIDIFPDDVIDAIFKAEEELFRGMRRAPERILIGPEDLTTLLHDKRYQEMAYQRDLKDVPGSLYFNGYACRVPIQVIPHMRGVLVL